MTGLYGPGPAGAAAMWVAAAATIVVLGGMLGERRLFGWSQHLFAGLLTGFLGLLALREVILPRLLDPLLSDPAGRPELWLGVALVGAAAGAPWLPRRIAAVPIAIAIGALAAFALGGAVIGTVLPQLNAAIPRPGQSIGGVTVAVLGLLISALVLLSFLHGAPRGRVVGAAAASGRWLLVVGLGGWLGYLLLSRLVLLLDRLAFLVTDVFGVGA